MDKQRMANEFLILARLYRAAGDHKLAELFTRKAEKLLGVPVAA